MQTHGEALGPVVDAQHAALAGSTGLTALLATGEDSIFDGEAPMTTAGGEPAADYLVISNPNGDGDAGLLMRPGANVRNIIDIWATTQAAVLAIYTEIALVLDGQPLDLGESLRFDSGRTRLLRAPRDPGRRRLYHGYVQYEAVVR